jgi:apolipoprotein N-acyltransferase
MAKLSTRAVLGFAAPLLAGVLSACGFEPLALWPLTFLAMAFLLDRIARAPTWRAAFGVAWFFAAGHFLLGLNWIATAWTYQANMPASYGIGAVVLLSFYLALFPAISAAVAWRIYRGRGTATLGFVLLFAALWIATEWLRGVLFTGFAWNPIGTVWLAVPPIAHLASWVGVYGLSGVLIVTAGALWLAALRQWRPAIGVAAALGVLAIGFVVLRNAPASGGIPVRIVQPNIGQDEKYDTEQVTRNERIYTRLSRTPTTHPRLFLWPEDATLRFLELEPLARAALARLLQRQDVLLTGGESVTVDADGRVEEYHNSVFALGSDGSLLWRYDKAHLVPFGEYLPLRPILERIGLSRLVPGEGDFSRGPGPRTFDVPGFGPVGVQVCYEIIVSGHVVERAHRPAFLFNPSNDAWFGAWGPPQHFAQARMRAIEEGVPVVRATPTGISGVIGPDGAVVVTLAPAREGVLDTLVPPPHAPTVFARLGLWASGLFALCLGVAGVLLARRPGMQVAG